MNILPSLRGTLAAECFRLHIPVWKYRDQEFPAPLWLEGQATHESGGFQDAYHADVANPDGVQEPDASYGLWQIEGRTANGLELMMGGMHRDFTFLYYPLTNLAFALRVLSGNLHDANGNVEGALARYNGGAWGAQMKAGPDGLKLANQAYVDKVFNSVLRVRDEM